MNRRRFPPPWRPRAPGRGGGRGAPPPPPPPPRPGGGGCGGGVAAPPSAAGAGAPGGARFYSPLVLNIAAEEGIPIQELERIPGTGEGGRVSKKTLLAYAEARKKGGGAQTGAMSPSV